MRGIIANLILFSWIFLIGFTPPLSGATSDAPREEKTLPKEPLILDILDIARVPAAFPVSFCLLTDGDRQYVAYYDQDHQMTIASRTTDSREWKHQILPTKVGWDSHNSIIMALDGDGYIHLSGNMHCVPLIYFRTARPRDITTFKKIDAMTGQNEKRCTYPKFITGKNNELIFHYRDGGSGNGNEIYNTYDLKSQSWRKLLDHPLTNGHGKMNAYMQGPFKGPDGRFHMSWVWRDTPDCSTNHDLSYARTDDLVHWESVAGEPFDIPIVLANKTLIVDPVPPRGGIINGTGKVGFDSKDRVVIAHHKFGANGKTQTYVSRFEENAWRSRQISDWDYRWDFSGGGSINFEIRLGVVQPGDKGQLLLPYSHSKYGSAQFVLDENTLKPVKTIPQKRQNPASLAKVESSFKGMRVKTMEDLGKPIEPGIRYLLRWETLPHNRDRKPQGSLPEASMLRLYRLKAL